MARRAYRDPREEERARLSQNMMDEYKVFHALQALLRQYKDTDFYRVLRTYHKVETPDDLFQWRRDLAVAAVELARAAAEAHERDTPRGRAWGPEVACPLCGYASGKPNGDGYKWPSGLERHLAGDYNTTWCLVIEALYDSRFRMSKYMKQSAALD